MRKSLGWYWKVATWKPKKEMHIFQNLEKTLEWYHTEMERSMVEFAIGPVY
jgi:hypothetical protein